MTNQAGTIDELLQLAIKAERNSETLYEAIGRMFIHYPAVSNFWREYAHDEAGHARWLEDLRLRLSADQLTQPADPDMWARATHLAATNPQTLLDDVADLQDAWELANDMENGETNMVLEFLITNFAEDPKALAFLRSQLRDHPDHLLTGFPESYNSTMARRSIRSA